MFGRPLLHSSHCGGPNHRYREVAETERLLVDRFKWLGGGNNVDLGEVAMPSEERLRKLGPGAG